MYADTKVEEAENGDPVFDSGYFIRVSGDVREISIEEIKAKNNPEFAYCIEDNRRYPAMIAFCLYRGKGEILDYDFKKQNRDHKLERDRFSFGEFEIIKPGLTITDSCIGCGKCTSVCSFDAIEKEGDRYRINGNRCDECGNCYINCPVDAISHKGI